MLTKVQDPRSSMLGSIEAGTSSFAGALSAARMAMAPKRKRAAKNTDTARMRIFCLFMRLFLVTQGNTSYRLNWLLITISKLTKAGGGGYPCQGSETEVRP